MKSNETFKNRLIGLQGNLLNFAYQLAAQFFLQPHTNLLRVGIKGVHDARDTRAHQRMGDRIDLDFSGIRHLFDANTNIHRTCTPCCYICPWTNTIYCY